MNPKHDLTREQNIFLARRELPHYIYNSLKLEEREVSLAEIEMILRGNNVGRVDLDVLQVILNLRRAWNFVLLNLDAELDAAFICKVNSRVFDDENLTWGKIRSAERRKPSDGYVPPELTDEEANAEIRQLFQAGGATEKAIRYFMWGCKAKLFAGGNRRTSMLCANKILIEAGEGLLTIGDAHTAEFLERRDQYFATGDASVLDQWLLEHCIRGLE